MSACVSPVVGRADRAADGDVAIAVGDAERDALVALQIALLEAAALGVEQDFVAVDQVPMTVCCGVAALGATVATTAKCGSSESADRVSSCVEHADRFSSI